MNLNKFLFKLFKIYIEYFNCFEIQIELKSLEQNFKSSIWCCKNKSFLFIYQKLEFIRYNVKIFFRLLYCSWFYFLGLGKENFQTVVFGVSFIGLQDTV